MKQTIIKLIGGALSLLFISSCEKIDTPGLQDTRPEIPITVSNATDYRPGPTVSTSKAGGGAITIKLEIPASSGRTIKEITKVATFTTYANVQNATAPYNAAPIPGSGTTVTFTTTIAEFYTKNATAGLTNPPASNANLGRQFYFLITLDNGQQLIPYPVYVLVLD